MGKRKARNRNAVASNVPQRNGNPGKAKLQSTEQGVVARAFKAKQFGFLKQGNASQESQDIFFHFDRVASGGLQLVPGDVIQFSIDKRRTDKGPSVFRGTLVKGKARKQEELIEFFEKVQNVFLQVDEERDKSNSNEGMLRIMSCVASWKCILESLQNESDIANFMATVVVMNSNLKSLKGHFKNVVDLIASSKLMVVKGSPLMSYVERKATNFSPKMNWFTILRTFLLIIVDNFPDKARNVVRLIEPFVQISSIPGEFFYDLLKAITCSGAVSVEALYWHELPLVPTIQEIEEVKENAPNDSLQLQPIRQRGPYASPIEYFEIMFRLLRADCFHSLKEGINKFLNNTLDKRDLNVYFDVRIVGIHISRQNRVCLAVKLKTQEKKIDWNKTTKLMFGNLLCISMNGQFNDVIWTTVASRDYLQSQQLVLLELCSELNAATDADSIEILTASRSKGMAAESPTYYRAYGPILKALQKQDPDTVSFKEELVDVRQTGKPQFLSSSSTFDANVILKEKVGQNGDVCDMPLRRLPTLDTIFDDSQQKAVIECLNEKIGIIQGPPGTGKTFIGVKLVQLLLSLSSKPSGPILVLTYKNHALDEFLKALMNVGITEVVRVGGGSKDGSLNALNVTKIEREIKKTKSLFEQMEQANQDLAAAETEVIEAFAKLKEAKKFSLNAFLSFVNGQQLRHFLLKCPWSQLQGPQPAAAIRAEVERFIGNLSYEELKLEAEKNLPLRQLIGDALAIWLPSNKEAANFEKYLSTALSWVSLESSIVEGDDDAEKEESSDDEKDVQDLLMDRRSAMGDGRAQFDLNEVLRFDKEDAKDNSIRLFECATEFLENFPTQIFSNINDFWRVKKEDALKLIQFIIHENYEIVGAEFKEKVRNYEQFCNVCNELKNQHRAAILKEKQVVAMTITGASINYDLLQELQPSIVIVEEAAELLEAQLVAALGSWTKQLILIGDHKQLKPSVETYYLERDYNMNLSLMERLIENGFAYSTLHKQNRMRPEFAELLLDIYPNLENNLGRVGKNEVAKCLAKSAYFWHHESPETFERSGRNEEEANRAVSLAAFMIEQGVEPRNITILSAYKGQNGLIRKKLKAAESKFVKDAQDTENRIVTHTIDNYQGDENDFVIISLVRSNSKKRIGFLKLLNRRCVAQSRSRCGLYFIGNFKMFYEDSNWAPMLLKMLNNELATAAITLVCPRHPGSSKKVSSATDTNSEGLCTQACGMRLECDHVCKKPCQPPHLHETCDERCRSLCSKCHSPCKKNCRPMHGHAGCDEVIEKQLPCFHKVLARCCDDYILCVETIPFVAKSCGHLLKRKCYEAEDDVKCEKPCSKVFDCGHTCHRKCWETCTPTDCHDCEKVKRIEALKREEEEKKMRKMREDDEKKKIEALKSKVELKPGRTELHKSGDTADEYFTIEDKVKKYIQPGHKWYPAVTKIEKVTNYKLEKEWRQAKLLMKDPEMRSELKFHGTSKDAIDCIIEGGFRLPAKPGMYGKGIYFATDSSKSAQDIYTKGSGMLLLCDVLIGKTMTVESASSDMTLTKLKAKSYDSLFAKRDTRSQGGVLYDEYVVYDCRQALPKYIISYQKQGVMAQITMPGSLVSPGKMTKHALKESRSVDTKDPLELHYRIAESQFLRLMNVTTEKRKIKSITYYSNPLLEKKFNDKKDELLKKYPGKTIECIFGFHGTSAASVDGIMSNNFRVDLVSQNTGNPGQYGAGIYFSEIPKVCFHYGESLLLCKVLLGRCLDVTKLNVKGKPLTSGYDSHGAHPTSDGNFQIIVIFNNDQILPCYVIENERV